MTMKAISIGDRGPAVEDIQRRLLSLGYNLGSSGVDGDFQADTQVALSRFQKASELPVTGVVDDQTWSALVDSSFAFGDRLLYLRAPHFHGADVAQLQEVLNTLGFYCGDVDAIFGTFTERAVSEFQANTAIEADGVVGASTFDALMALHHIWGGKSVPVHSAAAGRPRQRNALLADTPLELVAVDGDSYRIARRVANLAQAAQAQAQVAVLRDEASADKPAAPGEEAPAPSAPAPAPAPASALRVRLARTSEGVVLTGDRDLVIPIPQDFGAQASQQGFQHLATVILDAICHL
ncbi:MAG: peptidoglycan-binding protein [Coriobacteriia bacterium]|nr:peptidoglycan-binding protein [Coriobacteriia bacterium]